MFASSKPRMTGVLEDGQEEHVAPPDMHYSAQSSPWGWEPSRRPCCSCLCTHFRWSWLSRCSPERVWTVGHSIRLEKLRPRGCFEKGRRFPSFVKRGLFRALLHARPLLGSSSKAGMQNWMVGMALMLRGRALSSMLCCPRRGGVSTSTFREMGAAVRKDISLTPVAAGRTVARAGICAHAFICQIMPFPYSRHL